MKKQQLPEKICLICGRPFLWRKKWKRDWEHVKYCSERCRRNKKTGLVWFGNDLRVQDNAVLEKAILENERLIGVYCLDPLLFKKSNFGFQKLGLHRLQFLLRV